MLAIEAFYDSHLHLLDSLIDDDSRTGLCVPGRHTVEKGAQVLVHVTARGLPGDLMIEGEVSAESGTEVIVFATRAFEHQLAFLRAWAGGTAANASVREDRLAVARMPCVITLATPVARRESAKLLDVSDHGARIALGEPLARGTMLLLEMRSLEGLESFAASVMWSQNAMVGLQLCHSFPSERSAWARVVSEHRRSYSRRIITPLPDVVRTGEHPVAASDAADEMGRYVVVDREALERRRRRSSSPPNPSNGPGNVVGSVISARTGSGIKLRSSAEIEAVRDRASGAK
jgi:hypothetical protein